MPRWTSEAKEKQRQLIHQWKPWQSSSGPINAAGKKASSHNAFRHGLRSSEYRKYRAAIAEANRLCHEALSDLAVEEFFKKF